MISTVNIQHLESLADIVETITGIKVSERIPDWIIDQADELEVVDMSPQALRSRMRHGNVYPPERAKLALENYFREGNLNALRELVLRKVATTVEEDLEDYMRDHKIDAVWPAGERVITAIDDGPDAPRVLRRAWRIADRLGAGLLAVFVETPAWGNASPEDRRALEEHIRAAEDLGAEMIRANGSDVPSVLAKLARDKNTGTIVVGRPRKRGIVSRLRGSTVSRLLVVAPDAEVHIVAANGDG